MPSYRFVQIVKPPVYHRLSRRIRAHELLCWLALLLIRVAETSVEEKLGQHYLAPLKG